MEEIIKENNKSIKKRYPIPLAVSFIAAFDLIMSFFIILFGLLFTVLGALILYGALSFNDLDFFTNEIVHQSGFGIFFSLLFSFTLAIGIALMGIGALKGIVSIGLFKGKNWARIIRVLMSALWVSQILTSIIMQTHSGGYFFLLIHSVIIFYLILNSEVKKAFVFEI